MDDIINTAVRVLQGGGTLLYPTDTIWGLGCDAQQPQAVERLYAIKQRDHQKSMLVLVAEALPSMQCADPSARPTTYILPRSVWEPVLGASIAPNLPADDGSLGIRVARHPFCQAVIRRLGAPLVSTSANISGHASPTSYADIEESLRRRVDYCVPPLDEWISGETAGSRILKVNPDGSYTVIRP